MTYSTGSQANPTPVYQDAAVDLRLLSLNTEQLQHDTRRLFPIDPESQGIGGLEGQSHHENNLPKPDGGKAAWLFLTGCCTIEALVWGFPFAFGIFQDFYSNNAPFAGSANIPAIGTTSMGIMYLGLPLVFAMLQRWPNIRRACTVIGLLIMCAALAISSFCNTVWQLILTQGIMYAVGGTVAYAPTIIFIDEWFIQRKGFAYGVMWAGTGGAGVILPFFLEITLERFGFRTVLRTWTVVLFLLTAPLLYYVKPRLPLPARGAREPKPVKLNFLRSSSFGIVQVGNILEALGFFIPSIYLPTFANLIGASPLASTLTIVLFNIASVVGCVLMGTIVDRLHVTTCITISTIGSTIGVLLLWGLCDSLALLYVFCIVYGLFAGSFTSTWAGVMKEVTQRVSATEPAMVFAWLAAGRGVGNVVSGPLSEALLSGRPWLGKALLGYGSGYGPVIAFTGVTAALGGISVLGRRVGWI
ncbi:hypothetical protein MMC13_007530 [Lambiella insularis]|nr:hypothetical protein [Lambiella insularis]